MSITTGSIEQWTLEQILAVNTNNENRELNFSGTSLRGPWNEQGDVFEVLIVNGVPTLVDGHHRQHALREGWLTDLPAWFAVWVRQATTFADVRKRQDSHMDPKRTPTSKQKASIVDKRLNLFELESAQARRIGITAVKLLGFKGKTALFDGKSAYINEIRLINEWAIDFNPARYPQGILAAMLKTTRINAEQAQVFWAGYDSEDRSSRFRNRIFDALSTERQGESYNAELFGISVSMFDLWLND